MIESKLPPNAVELERGVLGALLLDNEAIHVISDIIHPESFYDGKNAIIYSSILRLFKNSIKCDILSVMMDLKKEGNLESIGGAFYLSGLTSNESRQYEYHARLIQQKYLLREMIRISTNTIKESYDDGSDCFDVINNLEKGLTEISKGLSVGKVKTISGLWNEVASHNDVLLTKKGVSGVPTGYENLDRITGGWQEPNLIIIAARPAMGKTSLAINFARNATVLHKQPVLIFSLEMSDIQIAQRIFSLESNVSNTDFTRRGIEADRMLYVQNECSRLINSPLYIDDSPGITLFELRSKARKLHREKGLKLIIVDYLQLMVGDKNHKGNREQEISGFSRGLKNLAKELKIPVIALSQLSRAVEQRGGDKRPQLSDLRESGAIEQDADMVVFIHRPEYYGVSEDENGVSTAGIAEIIFAKHRNGGTGTETLKWIDYLTKFESLKDHYEREIKDFTQPISANNNWENEGNVI